MFQMLKKLRQIRLGGVSEVGRRSNVGKNGMVHSRYTFTVWSSFLDILPTSELNVFVKSTTSYLKKAELLNMKKTEMVI